MLSPSLLCGRRLAALYKDGVYRLCSSPVQTCYLEFPNTRIHHQFTREVHYHGLLIHFLNSVSWDRRNDAGSRAITRGQSQRLFRKHFCTGLLNPLRLVFAQMGLR